MPKFTKRQKANLEMLPENPVPAEEAVKVLKGFKTTKFDQSVNVVASLGIDPKQADQALRGSIAMPKGIGRSARVIAFCNSDKVEAAVAAGAAEAGGVILQIRGMEALENNVLRNELRKKSINITVL
ncbi:MAG: hypothetical protein GY704_13035, partial [Phycisphaeraceae bacterium]|nr:hypothetical protein [Phycisphaeraceae bacterium]